MEINILEKIDNNDNLNCEHIEQVQDNYEIKISGILSEKITNYNSFVLGKSKKWRIPDNELKVYIIENNLIPHECKICKTKPFWRKKPLELVLDRINNEANDNSLENLRFLCPNCYSQVKKKYSIFERNIKSKMIRCNKCQKRIKYKTFMLGDKRFVESMCKSCLEQDRLESTIKRKNRIDVEVNHYDKSRNNNYLSKEI